MAENTATTELATTEPAGIQAVADVREQVNQIQYLMKAVLQEGEHYGKIPGTGKNAKPTLLQPGAEKIANMFKLVPSYDIRRTDFQGGHREVEVVCTLANKDGQPVGTGVGTCSTLESKYRYRWTGYGDNRRREENPDIADTWNTVLKMAKKRAFVDAVKSTTAASDIFTQDVEDFPEYMLGGRKAKPAPAPEPAPNPAAIAAMADEAAAKGYDRAQTEAWLASIAAQSGIEGARAQLDALLATPTAAAETATDAEAVEPDAIEGGEF